MSPLLHILPEPHHESTRRGLHTARVQDWGSMLVNPSPRTGDAQLGPSGNTLDQSAIPLVGSGSLLLLMNRGLGLIPANPLWSMALHVMSRPRARPKSHEMRQRIALGWMVSPD